MEEFVVLVDKKDQEIGVMEKLEAHKKGLLHRAFSVFVFNSLGQLLIHKRASSKYHSPGLWTNTCCSHPRPGESVENAAQRRLFEEMGITTHLEKQASFVYRVDFENGLIEHEFDHILVGVCDDKPKLNPSEAEKFAYADLDWLIADTALYGERYTFWFVEILKKFSKDLERAYGRLKN